MSDITIHHTDTEGTTVEGDPRPHQAALKAAGFTYRTNPGWFLRGSRFHPPRMHSINMAADGLRGVGLTVEIDIDSTPVDPAEREAHRAEQSVNRAEALAAKSARLDNEADRHFENARQISDALNGQPILIGHHSERATRRAYDKIQTGHRKGVEAWRDSQETARRSQAAEHNQARHLSVPVTLRRLEKLRAEARSIERTLTPCKTSGRRLKAGAEAPESVTCPACYQQVTFTDGAVTVHGAPTGEYLARVLAHRERIAADIAYWEDHVKAAEAAGVKVWGPDDFLPGDLVHHRFGRSKVVRVNRKSLSVDTGHSWTDKVTYDEVKGRTPKGNP